MTINIVSITDATVPDEKKDFHLFLTPFFILPLLKTYLHFFLCEGILNFNSFDIHVLHHSVKYTLRLWSFDPPPLPTTKSNYVSVLYYVIIFLK